MVCWRRDFPRTVPLPSFGTDRRFDDLVEEAARAARPAEVRAEKALASARSP
jgi:hypothetical protein